MRSSNLHLSHDTSKRFLFLLSVLKTLCVFLEEQAQAKKKHLFEILIFCNIINVYLMHLKNVWMVVWSIFLEQTVNIFICMLLLFVSFFYLFVSCWLWTDLWMKLVWLIDLKYQIRKHDWFTNQIFFPRPTANRGVSHLHRLSLRQ